jgi:hypothetical protein
MLKTHIPIERKFSSSSDEKLRDPDYLEMWRSQEHGGERWSDLLKCKCVVVLGEGKCGKTHEFKLQASQLKEQGVFSLFVPLELLQDHEFEDTITHSEESDLERWLNKTEEEGFIFLDAVDELKLRRGALKKAIRKVIEAIRGQSHRVRFFISCRPLDWHEELDLETVFPLTVTAKKIKPVQTVDGHELFSSVVAKDRNFSTPVKETTDDDELVKVVALLPLARDEILRFAELYAADYAKALETHLDEKELWHLYQLPSEIISGLDQLMSEGRLGDLQEQLLLGISQKLRESSDKKRNSLSEAKAIEGSESVALALFLTKRRSIYFHDSAAISEGVSIGDILSDWSLDDQTELLGKPLFDPTGVGAVRFHHRSTQEFLAARRLQKLREKGLATQDVFNLLFATVGNQEVAIPSMEPLMAWLALWNNDIMAELKKRSPTLLFRQGIPALLSIELRAELLFRFVEKYEGSGWRRIEIGHQELKRVADPELSGAVRQLWDTAYTGHETRGLLVELIYLTPMSDCSDLALLAAIDENLPSHHRTYAVLAVLKVGTAEQKRQIGKSLMDGSWPERLIRSVLFEMVPDVIDLDYFFVLSRSLKELPSTVHGLGYTLMQVVKSDSLSFDQKNLIRNNFTKAIWDGRKNDGRIYKLSSKYDHMVDALIVACWQTKHINSNDLFSWARSLAIAFKFGERRSSIIAREETEKLTSLLFSETALRETFFSASFEIVEEIEGPESDWSRYTGVVYDSPLTPFTEKDTGWLMEAVSPNSCQKRRGAAFYILLRSIGNEQNSKIAVQIADLISDRPDLLEELEKILNPQKVEPKEYELEHQRWEEEQEGREIERIKGWSEWRERVLLDIDLMLGDKHRENTLYNLYKAMKFAEGESDKWANWNSEFLETAFSSEFLERVQLELAQFWRSKDLSLFSERPEDARNSFYDSWLMVLWAVKCDASSPAFAHNLLHDEAVKAVRVSLLELNGFADFLSQLEVYHPKAVEDVFSGEVNRQIAIFIETGAAPIFHDILYRGSELVKRITSIALISDLSNLEAMMKCGNHSDIGYILDIVTSFENGDVRQHIVDHILTIIDKDKVSFTVENREFWFQRLAKLDIDILSERVLAHTRDTSTEEAREDAISLFATVFGQRSIGVTTSFDDLIPARRLDLLQKLVIRAYQTILPKDDRQREGTYTPGVRDDAEQARSYLLETLATTKSPKALFNLYELSSLPEFTHFSDRLKQMATELAKQISEPEPMDASTFRKFDQEQNYLPYNNTSLFVVMNNRLADFEHHLINDEFSTIDTLREVREETKLRRFISSWLNQNSRSAYTITQEAVVVSEKRTDIRLNSSRIDKYASIEAKLDDSSRRWSGSQLKKALIDQLVGQYLNHDRCRAGCLLICMREPRRWQNPDTKQYMDLQTTVHWLQQVANEIMEDRTELLLSVIGIDYSKTANE